MQHVRYVSSTLQDLVLLEVGAPLVVHDRSHGLGVGAHRGEGGRQPLHQRRVQVRAGGLDDWEVPALVVVALHVRRVRHVVRLHHRDVVHV